MFSFSIKANAQITPTPPTQSDSLFAFPQNYDNDVVYPIDSSGKVDKATSISCGYSSAAYINRYSNLNSYIPTANTPIIYINVAIHVFQDASGNNNWPNNTTTLTAFNQIMAWLNGDHSNNPTADPITANNSIPGDYISDSHIRYVLTGVYFYKNDYLNNGSGSAYFNSLYSYVQTNNPSSLTSLPIFITKGVYGNASGFTQMPPPASSGVATF